MNKKTGMFVLLSLLTTLSFSANRCVQDIEKYVKKERNGKGAPYQYVLHLESCNLRDQDIPKVVEYLQNRKDIYHLHLSDNLLTWKSAQILVESQLPISQLDISGNNLEEQGAIILSQLNASNESRYMTSLDMSKNNLNDKAAEALAKNTTFAIVILNKNYISNAGLVAFAHNPATEGLYLSYNQISDAGVLEFARITRLLRVHTIFRSLDLSWNHIAAPGIQELISLKDERLIGNLSVQGNEQI